MQCIVMFTAVNHNILREINLAISDKTGCISELFTKWKKNDFFQVGISFGVTETQNLNP